MRISIDQEGYRTGSPECRVTRVERKNEDEIEALSIKLDAVMTLKCGSARASLV